MVPATVLVKLKRNDIEFVSVCRSRHYTVACIMNVCGYFMCTSLLPYTTILRNSHFYSFHSDHIKDQNNCGVMNYSLRRLKIKKYEDVGESDDDGGVLNNSLCWLKRPSSWMPACSSPLFTIYPPYNNNIHSSLWYLEYLKFQNSKVSNKLGLLQSAFHNLLALQQ